MPDDPIESAPPSPGDDVTEMSPVPEEDMLMFTGTPVSPTEKPVMVIGRYKLIKELGEGGFGIVWLAEQTEPIRREVALKIIKPGMDSREIIARFEAERQALALMDHPNIAAVLDAGTTDRGQPYFVMELVKGLPITEYCDAHKFGIRDRLELFIPVCQAVQHAHQKAILHRDLKPSNILVSEVDGKPVPKVIDFGIAKALGRTRDEMLEASPGLTREGMIVGTPQYMSPEQAGSMPDVDTRSDVYTLGVILHELLIGQTPLSREEVRRAALDEMLRLIREGEIRRPSSRLLPITAAVNVTAEKRNTEPKKLGYALHGDLDWILLKTLDKDRARRYETANALAQDLRRHLQDEPVSAGPPSAGYRLQKLIRRNRAAFAAAATILLLLAAGIAASTWQAVRATKAEALAKERLVEVAKQKQQADQARDVADKARLAAVEAERQTKLRASKAESDAALQLSGRGEDIEALAHVTRSLDLDPDNWMAALIGYRLVTDGRLMIPKWLIQNSEVARVLAFSRDGKHLAAGCDDGSVTVTDLATGARHELQIKLPDPIEKMAFSPDGLSVAIATKHVIESWDFQTAANPAIVIQDYAIWDALSLNWPRADRIVVYSGRNWGSDDRITDILGRTNHGWEFLFGVADPRAVQDLGFQPAQLARILETKRFVTWVTTDGSMLVVEDDEKELLLWFSIDALPPTGQAIYSVKMNAGQYAEVATQSGIAVVGTGTRYNNNYNNWVRHSLLDGTEINAPANGQPVVQWFDPRSRQTGMISINTNTRFEAISPDGNTVTFSSETGTLLVDRASSTVVKQVEHLCDDSDSISTSGVDARTWIVRSTEGRQQTCKLEKIEDGIAVVVKRTLAIPALIADATLDPTGSWFAVSSLDRNVRVWPVTALNATPPSLQMNAASAQNISQQTSILDKGIVYQLGTTGSRTAVCTLRMPPATEVVPGLAYAGEDPNNSVTGYAFSPDSRQVM